MGVSLRPPPGETGHNSVSPEVRFLCDAIVAHLDEAALQPAGALDWDDVLARVRHHRLEPFMGPALAPEAGAPEDVRNKLKKMRRRTVLASMTLVGDLARLAEAFAEAGVEMQALKGPALAVLLYGDPLARSSCDIDLLVRPQDERAARAILAKCGYGVTADAVFYDANAVKLLHEWERAPVELHVSLDGEERLPLTTVLAPFEDAVEVMVGGVPVRTLRIETALLYAACHGAKHHWSRLYWLTDIAAATARMDIDWRRVAMIAGQTGTRRHLTLAMSLSGALFGRTPKNLPAPEGLDVMAIRHAWALHFDLLKAAPAPDLLTLQRIGQFRVLRADMALQTRMKARWALLLARMQPSQADRDMVSLPRGLTFFYYVVRVIRVLRTVLMRGVR